MRTIKFRGKNKNINEWVYGNLVIEEDGLHNIVNAKIITHCFTRDFICGGFDHYSITSSVKPDTIGQYTGLVDRNGVEIFEGDYVEVQKDGFGGVVTWHPHGYFYIKEPYKFKYDEEPDCLPIGEFIDNIKKQVTIVCNMHDNPELIPELLNE